MPTRAQIKERARIMLRGNYGGCVGSLFIVVLLAAIASYTFIGVLLVAVPLQLGLICYYLMVFQGTSPQISTVFATGFSINYARKVGGYLWMMLWTFLWSLLFFIPGLIKAYSYAMTPYILAAYPDVSAQDALKLSMRIMRGHKAELFILQLSFIGWALLSSLTCGILMILYVGPYMQLTTVGYYCELLDYAVRCGVVRVEELNGAPLQE